MRGRIPLASIIPTAFLLFITTGVSPLSQLDDIRTRLASAETLAAMRAAYTADQARGLAVYRA